MHKNVWPLAIVCIHWITALLVIGLFAVGFYMVELDYYDPLYRVLPSWHKSVGLIVLFITVFRLILRLLLHRPQPILSHSRIETMLAKAAHILLYSLLGVVFVSGYLISTADGRAIEVFNWFSIPAFITDIPNLEDNAGLVHYWATYILMGLVLAHALAAFKHHLIDKDETLYRMLGLKKKVENN